MLFRKRKTVPPELRSETEGGSSSPLGYQIDFDMMLKGTIYKRPSGSVRQYGVTVRGSTRLVTSGEWVDRDTYDALVEAGAVRPDLGSLKRIEDRKKRLVAGDVDGPRPGLS
jgi:hypothetical protein